jgi:tetratricopeptide (TPR) repeat protein
LNRYEKGEIAKVPDVPFVFKEAERWKDVNKLLRKYSEKMSKAELAFLKLFSLFRTELREMDFAGVIRKPIEGAGLNNSLIKMDDRDFIDLVSRLVEWRLISYDEAKKTYTIHPLIKGYFVSIFEETDKRLCHKRIYQYIDSYAPERPETLNEMEPLFEQVYHGCCAGLYDEVIDNVYWDKIGGEPTGYKITQKLGAWEIDLSLARTFFPEGDFSKMPLVSKKRVQGWLLNEAGLALLNTGRPKEAEEPLLSSIRMDIEAKDWENASCGYCNLVDLQFRTGRLEEGLLSAKRALELAEKAGSDKYIRNSKAYLGQILHLLGKGKEAGEGFRKADELVLKISGYRLYSLPGVFYADFLWT